MLDDIKIFNLASSMARYAADRHRLISHNIANADTVNFKAKDLEPFADAYARTASDNLGAAAGGNQKPWRTVTASALGIESPNGNTVSIEDQMMRSIDAQQDHEAATAVYKKAIDILRLSLGRGVS